MTRSSRAPAFALAAACLVLCGTASAQDREADAERLFREGQKLMEERRFGEACPKFEAAYRKDGQLGTLMNLAFCHKEQGAVWYAWLEFREAEVKATELVRGDRREFARQRLAELGKLLPKLVVDNPKSVPLTEVLVEDRKVPEAERGAVFAAEVGQRKLTFRARGKKPKTTLIAVAKSPGVQHVVVPDMEDAGPDDVPPAPTANERSDAGPDRPRADAPSPARAASENGSTQRTIGWIAIGAAGVSAVVGTVTGVITLASDDCKVANDPACTPDKRDALGTTAAISTASFIGAGVALAAGVVLVLTAPGGGAPAAPSTAQRARPQAVTFVPELGAGWAGVHGTF